MAITIKKLAFFIVLIFLFMNDLKIISSQPSQRLNG